MERRAADVTQDRIINAAVGQSQCLCSVFLMHQRRKRNKGEGDMLAIPQDYEEELIKRERETWGNEKYWYYRAASYMYPIEVDENTYEKVQFVSLNSSGEVIGYLGYCVAREERYVSNLFIINFTDDMSFGIDAVHMVRDIFEKYRYRKIVFFVIIGNPTESKYDGMIEHYGGMVVGTYKEHIMLPDG